MAHFEDFEQEDDFEEFEPEESGLRGVEPVRIVYQEMGKPSMMQPGYVNMKRLNEYILVVAQNPDLEGVIDVYLETGQSFQFKMPMSDFLALWQNNQY